MSKNYKVSDLILFLTFLQEEMKVRRIYFIHAAQEPGKNYIEFMVLDGTKKKNNVHTLRIFENGIKNANYFPPDFQSNPSQFKRFRNWLRRNQ